jgi:hypothetical protein
MLLSETWPCLNNSHVVYALQYRVMFLAQRRLAQL